MKIIKYLYFPLLFVIVLSSCSQPQDLSGFNESEWKDDRNGCLGKRYELLDDLQNVKDQLKSLNQNEVVALLGKPDRHELYKRNQKFFLYEISNAPECEKKNRDTSTRIYLKMRFNATGLSKEVLIYRD